MRVPVLLGLAALAACHNKSKLDLDRGGAVDALWDLAPDGTEVGVVASPRAIELAAHAVAAIQSLTRMPDLAPAKPQVDAVIGAMLGSPDAHPEDAGFDVHRGFAMFVTKDGVIGAMPVGDRDKFMASKHGTRGSDADTLGDNTCKELRGLYICATSEAMFARLGKAPLRGKAAVEGARGDVELYATGIPFLGDATGDLAAVARLESGQIDLRGRWTGKPDGMLAQLVGMVAPHAPDTDAASGFVALDLAPLLADAPPLPLAGGVTLDQLTRTMKGPVTAVIPTGSVDLQVHVPLSDPGPATTVIEHCAELTLFELAKTQTPGACRIDLQGTTALELDAWVENGELRLGAHKGAPPAGKAGSITPVGRELAQGDWTGAIWGRGTMLNLAGMAPATADLPPQAALGIHAIALVNELGAAVKVEQDGVRFRAMLRTAWTNPPDVVAKVAAIGGDDIAHGKASEPAKAIAAGAPGSPFAADFAAGQGGLMIPAAAIGIASAVVIPAFMRYAAAAGGESPDGSDGSDAIDGTGPDADHPSGPPMDKTQLTMLLVHAFAEEAYPEWVAKHPDKPCPTLAELGADLGLADDIPTETDPWGNRLIVRCGKDLPPGAKGIAILSLGPDGKQGTDDDIKSW